MAKILATTLLCPTQTPKVGFAEDTVPRALARRTRLSSYEDHPRHGNTELQDPGHGEKRSSGLILLAYNLIRLTDGPSSYAQRVPPTKTRVSNTP